ncbi:hypothetical protein BSL78_11472 [Apostichopus japonicus]|uniref:Uncharacterized protein n=1 Tax=Stichopus japonicus TaxID=307972 RepID=A0A2G8KUL1_STIJA|nr:hypothetical protein BSL78_29813 [Apostichopus japonicus]PIK51662.1 hypothetical protein BSL78_11472 [Apostichopus japonicus]
MWRSAFRAATPDGRAVSAETSTAIPRMTCRRDRVKLSARLPCLETVGRFQGQTAWTAMLTMSTRAIAPASTSGTWRTSNARLLSLRGLPAVTAWSRQNRTMLPVSMTFVPARPVTRACATLSVRTRPSAVTREYSSTGETERSALSIVQRSVDYYSMNVDQRVRGPVSIKTFHSV